MSNRDGITDDVRKREEDYFRRKDRELIERMRERGKEPVWGAEDTNVASLRLAAKMGFVPVDRLVLFAPPDQLP